MILVMVLFLGGAISSERSSKYPFSILGFKGECFMKGKFTIFEPAN